MFSSVPVCKNGSQSNSCYRISKFYNTLKKSLRYALRISAGLFSLFVLLYLLANIIIALKKESLNQMVIKQINKQVKGEVLIGDLAPDYFRTFPNISVVLSDVTIRDSLWSAHKHDFLNAGTIKVRIQLLSLVKGKPKIGKVIVENCSIHLYTDECGYCNLNRTEHVSFNKGESNIPEFLFKNSRIIIQNENLNSLHDIEIRYLNCDPHKKDSAIVLDISMKTFVHSIGFNLAKGSYLKEKRMNGDFALNFYSGKRMDLPNVMLEIEDHPYQFNGSIYFYTEPMSYDLRIQSDKLIYRNGVSLLTQALQSKLDSFDVIEPIDVKASVAGQMAFRVVPKVNVQFKVNDSQLHSTFGQFDHTTFSGSFSNDYESLNPPGDENSKLVFKDIYTEWSGIQLTSSLMEINNLIHPFLICDLHSSFELKAINDLT
ncbi:MAG TPA: AsmA family protein, partial [Saprospiraceae bacterium]|nr:AsmA family protein [Saprospiraceae bacterium]